MYHPRVYNISTSLSFFEAEGLLPPLSEEPPRIPHRFFSFPLLQDSLFPTTIAQNPHRLLTFLHTTSALPEIFPVSVNQSLQWPLSLETPKRDPPPPPPDPLTLKPLSIEAMPSHPTPSPMQ
eukprot:TRINITY_DN6198_c0_g1_i1.p1 TRINITY_DN6198_c0_g1~~TRINITY_DN6198_c0_g1_i1.p1  ORF type:complete len:122 (-),score=7.17 TRINITY_DN6198_c0_g1_i1:362-727(-)